MSANKNPIKHTTQAIQNWSFDETYSQQAVEILTENAGGTALERQKTIATEETLQAVAGLVTEPFDYIALTYVAAGDGIGEVQTAIFKTGGSGGTTVATLTLAYNGDDKLSSVTKT